MRALQLIHTGFEFGKQPIHFRKRPEWMSLELCLANNAAYRLTNPSKNSDDIENERVANENKRIAKLFPDSYSHR